MIVAPSVYQKFLFLRNIFQLILSWLNFYSNSASSYSVTGSTEVMPRNTESTF